MSRSPANTVLVERQGRFGLPGVSHISPAAWWRSRPPSHVPASERHGADGSSSHPPLYRVRLLLLPGQLAAVAHQPAVLLLAFLPPPALWHWGSCGALEGKQPAASPNSTESMVPFGAQLAAMRWLGARGRESRWRNGEWECYGETAADTSGSEGCRWQKAKEGENAFQRIRERSKTCRKLRSRRGEGRAETWKSRPNTQIQPRKKRQAGERENSTGERKQLSKHYQPSARWWNTPEEGYGALQRTGEEWHKGDSKGQDLGGWQEINILNTSWFVQPLLINILHGKHTLGLYVQGTITKRKWRGKQNREKKNCLVNSILCFKFPLAGTQNGWGDFCRRTGALLLPGDWGRGARAQNISEKCALLQSTIPQKKGAVTTAR